MDPQSRLLHAIKAKDPQRIRAAFAAGAKLNVADGQKSPLHAAAQVGDAEVFAALPKAAARKLLNQLDSTGRTPLMCAAQKSNLAAAQALIGLGADVNAANSMGETALRIAAAQGTPEMARLLLAAGADPLLPGRLMLTPLDRARERRTPEGRMITALFVRAGEAKAAKKPKKRPSRGIAVPARRKAANKRGRGKSKPTRRRSARGVR